MTNIGPNIEVHTPKMNTDTRAINPNNDKNRYAINCKLRKVTDVR